MTIEKGYKILKEYEGTEDTLINLDNMILEKLNLSESKSLFNYSNYNILESGCTYLQEEAELLNVTFKIIDEENLDKIGDAICRIEKIEII